MREHVRHEATAAPEEAAAPPVAAPALLGIQRAAGNRAALALIARGTGPAIRREVDEDESPEVEAEEDDVVVDEAALDEDEADELEDEDAVDGPLQTYEDVLAEIAEESATEPYRVEGDGEPHRARVRVEGGELVAGVNSTWTTVGAIERSLVLAGVPQADIDELTEDAHTYNGLLVGAQQRLRRTNDAAHKARAALARFRMGGPRVQGPPAKRDAKEKELRRKEFAARSDERNARSAVNTATFRLTSECKAVHTSAWEQYADVLGVHLQPAGELFKNRPFAGDPDALDAYHTGAQDDPIPIVWYKAPTDYPRLWVPDDVLSEDEEMESDADEDAAAAAPAGTVVTPFSPFVASGQQFGVSDPNRPTLGWTIRKVAHAGDRSDQRFLNSVLDVTGVEVETAAGWKPFGTAGHDGDHVKDLGFGGADAAPNYWPLLARINRRAFQGYNGFYQVNYVDTSGDEPVGRTRAIGGMIGYWFVVKGFLGHGDGAVPAESRTMQAGTWH